MAKTPNFEPRRLMELGVKVMRKSVAEHRADGKAKSILPNIPPSWQDNDEPRVEEELCLSLAGGFSIRPASVKVPGFRIYLVRAD